MTVAARMMMAVAMFSLCGCGGAVRIFRGTTTTAVTTGGTGGGTQTTATTGSLVKIYSAANQNEYVFEIAGYGGSNDWNATTNGTAVTFTTGQTFNTTVSNSGASNTVTSTLTLTSGTGTLDQTQLTMNLQGTVASNSGGTATTGAFTTSFAGVKD